MSSSQYRPCALLELPALTLKGLRSLFDAIVRDLTRKAKVERQIELGAEEFQDLLRKASRVEKRENAQAERAENDTYRAV